jgi:hypothetical protein
VGIGQRQETACSVTCVPFRTSAAGQGTSVLNAMWGSMFTHASGCTTQNQSFEANPTLGGVDETIIISTISHYLLIFLVIKLLLYNGVRGCEFLKVAER